MQTINITHSNVTITPIQNGGGEAFQKVLQDWQTSLLHHMELSAKEQPTP